MNEIEKALLESKSFQAIEGVLLEDRLIKLQAVDVLAMLYRKAAIISYDTGMGKTYLAAAVIRMLLNQDSSRKIIMVIKKKQLTATPAKVKKNVGVEILATASDQKSVAENILSNKFLQYPVLMITHECLNNNVVMRKLLEFRDKYSCIIIDEAHNLNNLAGASSANMLQGMCSGFEYRFALTATPITTNVDQFARLAYIMDKDTYPDYVKLSRAMKNGSFSIKNDPFFFISRKYSDFGIEMRTVGYPLFIEPQYNQIEASGADMFVKCKGPGAYNQANALVDFIREHKGERGLVYINQHVIREWVIRFLDNAGIRYGCINGKTSKLEDEKVMDRFNNKHDLDVVITSVTEAIDLDCDWVMFYEYTVNVAQMIGRASRGLKDKFLKVYFMITEDTGELRYFYDNIYCVSEIIQRVVGKRYDAVFDVKLKSGVSYDQY